MKSTPFTEQKVVGVMVFCTRLSGSSGSRAYMAQTRSKAFMMEWRKLLLFTAISQFSGS